MASLKHLQFKNPSERDDFMWSLVKLEALYVSVGPSEISKLGISKEEFVVDCQFGNLDCSQVGHFKLFSTNGFYNCYTFKINRTFINRINPGPQNGLSIIMKSNNPTTWIYDKSSKVAGVNGVKVVIHEHGTLPPILQAGFDIQSGFSTNVALIMRQHRRLNFPYGKCIERHKQNSDSSGTFIYSQELCEELEKAKEILLKCKCKSSKYFLNNYDNSTYCYDMRTNGTLTIKENILCELYAAQKLSEKVFEKCVWPCEQTDYDIMSSQTEWPQNIMISDFIDKYIKPLRCASPVKWFYEYLHYSVNTSYVLPCIKKYLKNMNDPENIYTMQDIEELLAEAGKGKSFNISLQKNLKITFDPSIISEDIKETKAKWIQKYFNRLNVYFTKSTIEKHRQIPTFGFTDLFSNVGGVLGLWVGVSFITIFEILVFGCQIIHKQVCKSKISNDESLEQ